MRLINKTGESIIDFPSDYVVIDFETTGYDRRFDEIIEMAAIKIKNDCVVDSFDSFIKPEIPIDGFITELTGITNEMVANAPAIGTMIPRFLDFIENLPLVGHFVSFDVNFLCENTSETINNNYIDTLRLSRKLYPELPHHRLRDMVQYLDIPAKGYHRSLYDCENCLELFKICKRTAAERYDSFDDFYKTFKHSSKHSDGRYKNRIGLDKINIDYQDFDETHPFFNKQCVFTGMLDKLNRTDAMQLVINVGGTTAKNVTKSTNYLILGNNDYCKTIKDGKSSKQKKAEALKLAGQDIEIISERTFYDLLNIED